MIKFYQMGVDKRSISRVLFACFALRRCFELLLSVAVEPTVRSVRS